MDTSRCGKTLRSQRLISKYRVTGRELTREVAILAANRNRYDGHKQGRPVEKPGPDQIPDSPEKVLRSLVASPPRREDQWEYLKRHREALE